MSLADKLRDYKPTNWKPRPEVLCCLPLPVPMHGMAPRVVLGEDWWNAVRFAAYKSTRYHCIACGVLRFGTDWCDHLEGHEIYDIDYLVGRMVYKETVPLCTRCHRFIHIGYLNVQYEQGVITLDEVHEVMNHGSAVLKKAGLKKPTQYSGPTVEWSEWRLVIGEDEYPPLYKSFAEYKERFR